MNLPFAPLPPSTTGVYAAFTVPLAANAQLLYNSRSNTLVTRCFFYGSDSATKMHLGRRESAEKTIHGSQDKRTRKTRQTSFRHRAGPAVQNGRPWSACSGRLGPAHEYGQRRRCFCRRAATHTREGRGTLHRLASPARGNLPHPFRRLWKDLAMQRAQGGVHHREVRV